MKTWERQRERVQQALADPAPVEQEQLLIPHDAEGHSVRAMSPAPGIIPRQAAVLIVLYPEGDDLWLPLTVRNHTLPQHAGEVSLPGGAADLEDDTPVATALRETYEELGIPADSITILGLLTPVYIAASNFSLTPVVGFMPTVPVLFPCSHEVAEVFSVSLTTLCNPATVVVEKWVLGGTPMQVPFFALHGHKVWGATALVVSELIARLNRTT